MTGDTDTDAVTDEEQQYGGERDDDVEPVADTERDDDDESE
jgi:hypothetical protein